MWRIRDLWVFHVYVTCEFFTYTWLASFSHIRNLRVFGVYVTCQYFAYTWLASFSHIRDLRVFHVYVTCKFFTYTQLESFWRIRHLSVFLVYVTCEFFKYTWLASFSRIRPLRVFHVYVTWEAYTDGRSRSLKSIYSPPRTFHSDRLFYPLWQLIFESETLYEGCQKQQKRVKHGIRKTCLCDLNPLTPHFYIVKLGFTGVYIIFYFLL